MPASKGYALTTGSGTAGQYLQANGDGSSSWVAAPSGGVVTFTDEFHVDGVLGNDSTGDGSMSKPYKTIQTCLNAIGMPTCKQDSCRKIKVFLHTAYSSAPEIITSQANNFDGIYQEGTLASPLWVPPRMITFHGPGTKIGNAGDATGYGFVLGEVSTGRRFGASSSEVRHTMTFQGLANCRDTHQRIRNGIHIGAGTRIAVVKRSIDTIQGDATGANDRVTIVLKSGQFPYSASVSPWAAWGSGTSWQGVSSPTITLDGATSTITYAGSPNPITNSSSANQGVFFRDLSGITGLSVDVVYYVVNATGTTFQVSTSVGGAAVAFTGTGTGVVCGRSNTSASAQLPFEPLIRIAVSGTTNYNTAYDIIQQISATSFIARRVTGTNTSSALETPVSASFYETDTTGGSGQTTHDVVFNNAYQQGTLSSDDGTNNGGAPHAGGCVVYIKDSRFFGGMLLPTNGTDQRWENSQVSFFANIGATVTSYSRTTNVVTITTSTDYAWASGMVITVSSSTSGGGQNIDGTWTLTGGGFGTATFTQVGADYGSQTPTASSPITAASNVGTVVSWDRCSFSGTAAVQSFTYSTDDMGICDCRWNASSKMHIISTSAAPQARMDTYSAQSFTTNGTWSLPVTFTDAGDLVTRTAHALWNGAAVSFSNITTTTGISVSTTYYVISATANTFQLALTPGGAAIALTTNGSGIMDVSPTQYTGYVDLLSPTQQVPSLVWVQNASNTIANDATEKTLLSSGVGTLQLPANWFKFGRALRISGFGFFSTQGNPTFTVRVTLTTLAGVATTMVTTGVVTMSNETNALITVNADLVCQATGASGKFFSQGIVSEVGSTMNSRPMVTTAQTTLSTTVAYLVNVTAQWGTASANNTITLTNFTITG